MRLTVLGCAGSFPGPDSPCSAYLVQAEGFGLLLDFGTGAMSGLFNRLDHSEFVCGKGRERAQNARPQPFHSGIANPLTVGLFSCSSISKRACRSICFSARAMALSASKLSSLTRASWRMAEVWKFSDTHISSLHRSLE